MNAATSMKPSNRPRAREEIIELFQACAKKARQDPGGTNLRETERSYGFGSRTSFLARRFHRTCRNGRACLHYLDVLARGERPPLDASDEPVSTVFGRRSADVFRCLGFEVTQPGQDTGRRADALALYRELAVIIDARVGSGGYVLGTEHTMFLEYARRPGEQLKRRGYDRVNFVVVASYFKDEDRTRLKEVPSETPIRNALLVSAFDLMEWVEASIRERNSSEIEALEARVFVH